MFENIFKKFKNYTQEDLLKELLNPYFKESLLDEMMQSGLDINWQNDEGESYLHLCAKKNLTISIDWLIKNKIKTTLKNKNKESAVFCAVNANNVATLQQLLDLGLSIDVKNRYNRTPLQEAIMSDRKKVLDFLIENSKDINSVDINNRNIIFDAVANGNRNIVSKVLEIESLNKNQIDVNGNTILHESSVIKNDELAMDLLDAGVDPTIRDAKGKSYLFYLTQKGIESLPVLNKAIALGFDINKCLSEKNESLLMSLVNSFTSCEEQSSKESLQKMMVQLISKGINLNIKDINGETVLFYTVKNKDIETTHFLLKQKSVDINEKNNLGDTVLSIAVVEGSSNLDMVVTLLKFKADANSKNMSKKSIIETVIEKTVRENPKEPNFLFVLNSLLENSNANLKKLNSTHEPLFFDVVFNKRFHLLKLFRQYGFDLNQEDIEGNNIIHNVIKKFREKSETVDKRDLNKILSFLITKGIDVNCKDSQGRSVLHNAVVEDWENIIKLLLDAKADINSIDKRGRSLAHCCVWKNDSKNFKILHSYDAKVLNIADEYGILPINYAAFMGFKDLVVDMIEAGAYVNNTNEKNPEIVETLIRHKENLDNLYEDKDTPLVRRNISLLVENMKKEFF